MKRNTIATLAYMGAVFGLCYALRGFVEFVYNTTNTIATVLK